jgi:hypothetical protein
MALRDRKLSSGTGAAVAPAVRPPAPHPSSTGTSPGAHRGRGLGEGLGRTDRTDNWWFIPVIQAIGLLVLIGYANYAAFLGAEHYHYVENGRDYLSPFYSPYLKPAWLPGWLSPALLILIFPLGFRATCYYYRKAYYRSFFLDPIGCAVGEPRKAYAGETKFPLILQNVHRYFLYAALVFLVILWIDVFRAFLIDGGVGVGLGSIMILLSTGSLTLYTFSCHSLRHLVGGQLDCFSCAVAGGPRQKTWSAVTRLNEHHMGWAWFSLFCVCGADLYVRLCSMGVIRDPLLMTLHGLFDMPAKPFGP